MSNQSNKEFNLSVTPLWYNTNGNLRGLVVDKAVYDAIQKVEVGGKLFVKFLEKKKDKKSPDAYIEYITPSKLAEARERLNKQDEEKADSL